MHTHTHTSLAHMHRHTHTHSQYSRCSFHMAGGGLGPDFPSGVWAIVLLHKKGPTLFRDLGVGSNTTLEMSVWLAPLWWAGRVSPNGFGSLIGGGSPNSQLFLLMAWVGLSQWNKYVHNLIYPCIAWGCYPPKNVGFGLFCFCTRKGLSLFWAFGVGSTPTLEISMSFAPLFCAGWASPNGFRSCIGRGLVSKFTTMFIL